MILDILVFTCADSFFGITKVAKSLPGQPFQAESWDGIKSHVLLGLGTHWPERSGTQRVFAERFGGRCVEPQKFEGNKRQMK